MKNLIIIFILALCATMANAQVKVLGKIEPNGPTDTYPTHVDSLGRGGFMAVKTWQERNNIPLPRRKAGMMVSVKSATVDSLYRLGVGLTNADWLPYAPSADVSGKANLTGGNTFTGTQTIDGNVGIGLTNPSSKFHVRLGTDKNILFRDNGSNSEIVSVNNAFNNYKPLNFAASEYYFNADIYAGIHSINAANLIGDVTGNLNGTATNWGPLNFSYINEGTIPTHFLVSENIDNGVIKYSDVGDVKTALSISLQDVTDFGNTTNNKLVTSNSIEWGTGTYEVGKSKLYNTASDGTILTSKAGSALDFTLTNGSGSSVFEVPHGTIDTRFYGNITASATGSNIRFDPSLTNPSGIYQSGSGDNILYFGNYANSNKALVVNPANGNIGAGTTDPNAKLHIRQSTDKNVLIRDNGTNSEIISLNDAQTARQPLGLSASLFDFTDGNMQLTGNIPTFSLQGTQVGAKTYALTNGIIGVSNTGFAIRNTTDNRNELSINGSGNIGIGTPSPTEKLDINGNVKAYHFIVDQTDAISKLNATNLTIIDGGSVSSSSLGAGYLKLAKAGDTYQTTVSPIGTLTANRSIYIPDASGTLALMEQVLAMTEVQLQTYHGGDIVGTTVTITTSPSRYKKVYIYKAGDIDNTTVFQLPANPAVGDLVEIMAIGSMFLSEFIEIRTASGTLVNSGSTYLMSYKWNGTSWAYQGLE